MSASAPRPRRPLIDVARDALRHAGRARLLVLAGLLIGATALLDVVTGPDVSFSIFYLLPVALVARFASETDALAIAGVAALVWVLVDPYAPTQPQPLVHFWNSSLRLALFLIVASLLSRLVAARSRQRRLIQFIARDLRGPLTNILRSLDALERTGVHTLEREQRELVSVARASGRRMLPLVHALVDLDRLASRRLPLTLADVDVEHLLQPAFDEIGLWSWERGIAMVQDVAADVPLVHADRDLTVRVLVNLLSEAVRRCPPDARIAMRVRSAPSHHVRFTIEAYDGLAHGESGEPRLDADTRLAHEFCAHALEAQGGRLDPPRATRAHRSVSFTLPARHEPDARATSASAVAPAQAVEVAR